VRADPFLIPALHPLISLALAHLADTFSSLLEHQSDGSLRYWISLPPDELPASDCRSLTGPRATKTRHRHRLDLPITWYETRFPISPLLDVHLRALHDPTTALTSSRITASLQDDFEDAALPTSLTPQAEHRRHLHGAQRSPESLTVKHQCRRISPSTPFSSESSQVHSQSLDLRSRAQIRSLTERVRLNPAR
jgi:hypothetical protein